MTIKLEDVTIYEGIAIKKAVEAMERDPQRLELSEVELNNIRMWKTMVVGNRIKDYNLRAFEVHKPELMLAVLEDYLEERQGVIEQHGMTYGEKDYRLELTNLIEQIREKIDDE